MGVWCQWKHACFARRNSRFESEHIHAEPFGVHICPDRLLAKTLGFQPGKQSSILCRDASIASVAKRPPQTRLFSLRSKTLLREKATNPSEVAQLAERSTVNREVEGSNPSPGAQASLAKLVNAAGLDPVVARLVGSTPTESTHTPWRVLARRDRTRRNPQGSQ